MRYVWKTLTCTALLGLTMTRSVEARTPRIPVDAGLTEQESMCQVIGDLDYQSALARDAGVPYLKLIARLRSMRHGREEFMVVALDTAIKNASNVYLSPTLTPIQVRNYTQLVCARLMDEAIAKKQAASVTQRPGPQRP